MFYNNIINTKMPKILNTESTFFLLQNHKQIFLEYKQIP